MFSKQTLSFLPECLPQTHAALDTFLMRHDLDDKITCQPGKNSIPKISVAIMRFLIANQDAKDSYGNNICTSVMKDIISDLLKHHRFDEDTQEFKDMDGFYRYLRLDGYDLDLEENKLTATFPEDIEVSKKDDCIQEFLDDYDFITTKEHYDNAKSSYVSNNLAAFTGQLRTFTESLFMEMANDVKEWEPDNLDISSIEPNNAITAMQVLAKCHNPILNNSLNEWMGDSKGYFEAYWRRLHPKGSHPGIPELDEVIYRYQLVVLNTHYLIQKFKKFY